MANNEAKPPISGERLGIGARKFKSQADDGTTAFATRVMARFVTGVYQFVAVVNIWKSRASMQSYRPGKKAKPRVELASA
ncbi:hypothetical protein SAMN05216337_11026 [Bradyrhizobium brasilense]|uniref:Uncharacterized protein n=1 Tax=Bradyrhizobium brasilense TaxID=1419277 RepID=A0A1G7QQ68_9BRAD|nr:hypothetical protein [Bradyrhizobium brasilense]SDG00614.1 hypothetical protein SAMN05216337_11026 [Bradyrhizobium brasilense]